MNREFKLKKFILKERKQINKLNKTFTKLFNECGKKHDDTGLQLGLLGAIILGFLKSTNIEKKEQKKLLKNCLKMLDKKA